MWLDSIFSSPSSNTKENSPSISRRMLGGTTSINVLHVRMDLIDDPGHSRLSLTSFGGDLVSRKARFRKKTNISSSRRRNEFYSEVGWDGYYLCYIVL